MKLKLKQKLAKYGFDQHLDFFRKPILLHDLKKKSTLDQYGFSSPGVGFVLLRNKNITSIDISEKMEDLGEKHENPCLKIFSGVPGQKLALG